MIDSKQNNTYLLDCCSSKSVCDAGTEHSTHRSTGDFAIDNPTISVITATFNASTKLQGLIDSLSGQSDRNFEWIVVDGASSDATVEMLESSGDIVSEWSSEPDFGIYDALNKAIRKSTGEYYLVLGADDRLHPDAVAQYRRHATLSGADLVTASIIQDGRASAAKLGRSWWNGMFAFVSGHSVGTLIRRSLHDRFGYYSRRFPIAADMYFIKTCCMSADVRVHRADFVAGELGNCGVSSSDRAATFCDCFRVQIETERSKLLQILIFVLKILWRTPQIIAAARIRGTAGNQRS